MTERALGGNRGAGGPGDRVVQIDTTSAAPAAITNRRRAISMDVIGPVLLVVSVAARLAWTYLAPNGANFVDLHVYVGGAAMIDHPGSLYRYVYADQTPDFPLPFTYPPFAAVIFYPLHLLPFGVVAFCWTVGTMAALYGVVRLSQRLLGVASGEGHRLAMLWTGVAIWLEPLRSTFDYGQINVLLALAVLCGGVQHPMVVVGSAGRDGGGGEADARDRRTLFRRCPPVGRGGILRGRLPGHHCGVDVRRR